MRQGPDADIDESELWISHPKDYAAGIPAVLISLERAYEQMGAIRTARTLPTLGRTDLDVQAGGKHSVSVDDSIPMVHLPGGWLGPDGTPEERRVHGFRVVAYSTPKGNAAAYCPESNPLVPLGHVAKKSDTPASKAITVRLEPAATKDSAWAV